jgi:hypothetical protein
VIGDRGDARLRCHCGVVTLALNENKLLHRAPPITRRDTVYAALSETCFEVQEGAHIPKFVRVETVGFTLALVD